MEDSLTQFDLGLLPDRGSSVKSTNRRCQSRSAAVTSVIKVDRDAFEGEKHSSCDARTCDGPRATPTRLPQPLSQHRLSQKASRRRASKSKGDDFEDAKMYLGLTEGSLTAVHKDKDTFLAQRVITRPGSSLPDQIDLPSASGQVHQSHQSRAVLSPPTKTNVVLKDKVLQQQASGMSGAVYMDEITYEKSLYGSNSQQAQPWQQSMPPPPPLSTLSNEFAEEEALYQLIDRMLTQTKRVDEFNSNAGGPQRRWDTDAVISALHPFVGEFEERICRFIRRGLEAFPFYQPEMQKMRGVLTRNYSAIGDAAADSELLLFMEQLRSMRLQMQLFLRPDEALAESDDAALVRLLLAYSEQLDRDLRAAAAGTASLLGDAIAKYARRRATVLASAVNKYARTSERRRQLILGRMQGLASTVMGFVSRCPSSSSLPSDNASSDSGFRMAVVHLFDDMLACFACLGSVSGGRLSRAVSPAAAAAVVAAETAAISQSSVSEDDDRGDRMTCYDNMSAVSTRLPPPPHTTATETTQEKKSSSDTGCGSGMKHGQGDGAGDKEWAPRSDSPELASRSESTASIEPQEAISLQFMERVESLLSSFLPNERVDSQVFKTTFNSLWDWWRRAGMGCADHHCDRRMDRIREKFERAHQHRAGSNGVRRLCSDSEIAWDLIEVAKLMVPSEKRSTNLTHLHTAPEWRETTLLLVDSALATLYLYQLAQDASVLSMRLRTDLNRLTGRLVDCGPVPLLSLLRLRLMYLRARQYSDLLRAHPQGCILLELAQVHRVLHGDDTYPRCSTFAPLNLSICVPLDDYKKFCQHMKDVQVLSFEACAPVTDQTSQLTKSSCLRKIEKCCQCTIELQHANGTGSASSAPNSDVTVGGSPATAATSAEDALTSGATSSRRKPQLLTSGGGRPSFSLIIRPDLSHGRANAAMRMIYDIVGPAVSIRERVKYRKFQLSLSMPHGYRPLTVFADTSRSLTE